MAKIYREWVIDAREGLRDPDKRAEAMTALRAIVHKIVLTPNEGELAIDVAGDLAVDAGGRKSAIKFRGPADRASARSAREPHERSETWLSAFQESRIERVSE